MSVKQYLKEFTAEQLRASITPKQTVPLFADKLLLLSRHIEKRLLLSSFLPTEIFVTARDQAFFKALFSSDDHGYLLRATIHQGHIVDKPLLSPAVDSRLRKYTRDANIDSGETLHSFRSDCALTLAFSSSPLADVVSRWLVKFQNSF